MAGKKISQLTALGGSYAATDLFEISKDMGGGTYASRKITGAELTSSIGAGTVTSVDVSGGTTGLTTSGGPITGTGTITIAGTLAIANGGTGASTPQAAIDALTSVSGAATGEVLTKDASGNATWAAAAGGATALGGLSDCTTPATDNYGIGTGALASLTTGDNNIALGKNAGTGITASSDSIAIGTDAMTKTHTGLGRSVAIGYQALKNATNRMNVAIGYVAGVNTSTGEKNVYIGYDAGSAVTTGSTNVCIGTSTNLLAGGSNQICIGSNIATTAGDSLYIGKSGVGFLHGEYATVGQTKLGINLGNTWQNPDATLHVKSATGATALLVENNGGSQVMKIENGGDNIAIGGTALDNLSTGTFNVGIGLNAGTTISTGVHNTILGRVAGNLGNPSYATYIGSGAGYSGGAGGKNVAVGWNAGYSLGNSASNNTLIGSQAGAIISSGTNNVVLGYYAADNLTTGSDNIIIGYNVDASSATVSNELKIGDQIVGNMDSAGDRYTKFLGQVYTETATLSGTSVNIDWFDSNVKRITLSGDTDFSAATHLKDGATYVLIIHQPGGANYTATFGSVFKWEGGTAPTLTATNGATDIITFVSDGTNLYGVAAQNFS